MSATTAWTLVAILTVVTFAIKAAGPIALGGRALPPRFEGVINLTAPALLSALVVTETLADGKHLSVDAHTAGVGFAALVMWRTRSVIAAVVSAAALTAILRALT